MKKALIGVCSAAFLALNAHALTLIGNFTPNTPSNPAQEVSYINTLINPAGYDAGADLTKTVAAINYELASLTIKNSLPLPSAIVTGAFKDDTNPLPAAAYTDVVNTGFTYVLGKYGNISYVWSVAADETFSLPASLTGGGISHISMYRSDSDTPGVPDSGSTIALLGLAVAALAFAKRKF